MSDSFEHTREIIKNIQDELPRLEVLYDKLFLCDGENCTSIISEINAIQNRMAINTRILVPTAVKEGFIDA